MDQDQLMRDSRDAPSIVQFLLDCDPRVKLQKFQNKSLLHVACLQEYNGSNIEVGIQVIKVIHMHIPRLLRMKHVQAFINGEMIH